MRIDRSSIVRVIDNETMRLGLYVICFLVIGLLTAIGRLGPDDALQWIIVGAGMLGNGVASGKMIAQRRSKVDESGTSV
ncbi:hypothetical protein BKG57_05660 [Mycobacteroides chelonae]|jgi:hypothetical protein|nr:hypothetical protein BKG57_05660 [Mycobacteroides chelonae]